MTVASLCIAHSKREGTRAETRFGLPTKRTSPFKLAGGGAQFSRLLAAEVCASAVVMVVMLDTPCSAVECKTTGYPLHSYVSPSLPLPCVTVCHQVPNALYQCGSAVGSCLVFVVTTTDKATHPLELRTPITVELLDETGNCIPTVSFI